MRARWSGNEAHPRRRDRESEGNSFEGGEGIGERWQTVMSNS